MGPTDQEREIIRRIFDFDEHGITQMFDDVMENPVSKYTDPDHFQREIEVLFRQFPIVIAHRSQLANPGDFLTHGETGVPILVTRTVDGHLKAFLNVCRHRGATLESEPCGNARRFSCPYHAWTYDLDGALRGLPQPVGFDSVDRAGFGLVELPVFDHFGLIWVVPSPRHEPIDIDAWFAPLEENLGGLDLGEHHLFRFWTLHRDINWRILLEGFQESYHFCSAHRHTACSSYLDNQSVWTDLYPHVRHSVPLPRVLAYRDQPEDTWDYRSNFMDQNYVFPANFAQVMTDHVYIHTVIPTGIDSCVFQCMMLTPEEPATEKAERHYQKNHDVVRVVFDEDFAIGEGIQQGLATRANQHFTFGRYECGLHLGQRSIDAALTGELRL
ncbi:MAG: (2Fe-2S)-binding protein [Acidimicrobiaceae bacterium]|nr:(2Fe-2S)-binding protein [Acidimicrobiaceae bacterium]